MGRKIGGGRVGRRRYSELIGEDVEEDLQEMIYLEDQTKELVTKQKMG